MVLVPVTANGVAPPRDFRAQQLGQLGQSLVGAGAEVVAMASEEQARRKREADELQEKVDIAKAREIDALMADEDREDLFGFVNKIGKDAVDGYADLRPRLKARTERGLGMLQSDAQREAFSARRAQREEQFANRTHGHWAEQVAVHDQAQTEARRKGLVLDAISYFDPDEDTQDPQRPTPLVTNQMMVDSAASEARSLARKLGLSPEATKLAVLDSTTAVHEGRIRDLLRVGRTKSATDYLERNADSINPDSLTDLRDRVGRSADDDTAAQLADSLAGTPVLDALDILKAQNTNGDITIAVRDKAAARLKAADDERRQQEAVSKVDAFDAATEWLSLPENRGKAYELMPNEIQSDVESLGLRGKVALWIENGNRRRTSEIGMSSLIALRANPAPLRGRTWAEVDEAFTGHWDDKDRAMAADLWAEANKQPKPVEDMPSSRVDKILFQALQDAELLPTDRNVEPLERTRKERIEVEVETQIRDRGGVTNDAAGDEIVREIIRGVLLNAGTIKSGETIPFAAQLPTEKAGAVIGTSTGEVIEKQEIESGSRESQFARQIIAEKNREIVARNAAKQPGEPVEALIPTNAPQIAQAMADRRAVSRSALSTLKTAHRQASIRGITDEEQWEALPSSVVERLRELGLEDDVRQTWATWSAANRVDFLGRPIDGHLMSPWRNR